MKDYEKPTYDELEALAYLGIHTARDLSSDDVKNANEGAKVIKAYSYALFERLGGRGFFQAWGIAIPLEERFREAIDVLESPPAASAVNLVPDLLRAHFATVLRQACDAILEADRDFAAHPKGDA